VRIAGNCYICFVLPTTFVLNVSRFVVPEMSAGTHGGLYVKCTVHYCWRTLPEVGIFLQVFATLSDIERNDSYIDIYNPILNIT
jgi:hypothetical protein